MKTYSVLYNTTTTYEAVVKAKNEKEAIAKVKEVIGEPIVVEEAWLIKRDKEWSI